MNDATKAEPQWATSSRLLKLGESIEFQFHLPSGSEAGELAIFPRDLERAQPGACFVPGGDLAWLDALSSEQVTLDIDTGQATVTYQPEEPGSYLARWRVGNEQFYRYFSAIEDDWTVLRFSTFMDLESEPTLHSTGIPLDYRLPAERFDPDDELFRKFLDYHRYFGDAIIPAIPDTPEMAEEERVQFYGELLDKVRAAMPFPKEIRSARLELRTPPVGAPGHGIDPGYTRALAELGINDHCGMWAANGTPWLGMPEFPYYSSPVDCRKVKQDEGGTVVGHQWDFCGSWHFLGPVTWHFNAGAGDWSRTEACLRSGLEELRDSAAFSGHPVFALPLYDGVRERPDIDPHFRASVDETAAFVERYQRFMAFDAPKDYRLVYARSIDIVDYFRRHFRVTPRTLFVSTTDHVMYDKWWLNQWYSYRSLIPRERIPWETRVSTILRQRGPGPLYKDPLSYEYLMLEDQHRLIRFERECPNPIWWFDYTHQEAGPEGSAIRHTETPDVDVVRSGWFRAERGLTMTLRMVTEATLPDYAIVLWELPPEFSGDPADIETNAKEHIVVWNRGGEYHAVLLFDLEPGVELRVLVKRQAGR